MKRPQPPCVEAPGRALVQPCLPHVAHTHSQAKRVAPSSHGALLQMQVHPRLDRPPDMRHAHTPIPQAPAPALQRAAVVVASPLHRCPPLVQQADVPPPRGQRPLQPPIAHGRDGFVATASEGALAAGEPKPPPQARAPEVVQRHA